MRRAARRLVLERLGSFEGVADTRTASALRKRTHDSGVVDTNICSHQSKMKVDKRGKEWTKHRRNCVDLGRVRSSGPSAVIPGLVRHRSGRGNRKPQKGMGRHMAAKKSGSGRSSSPSPGRYRSAQTGRYVTPKYGKSHKSTTVKESK
jgi:hypothetical protein